VKDRNLICGNKSKIVVCIILCFALLLSSCENMQSASDDVVPNAHHNFVEDAISRATEEARQQASIDASRQASIENSREQASRDEATQTETENIQDIIPPEGGVYFDNSNRTLRIVLPRLRAATYLYFMENNFLDDFIKDQAIDEAKDVVIENLKNWLANIGYELGPTASGILAITEGIDIIKRVTNFVAIQYYKNELKKVDENGFLLIDIIRLAGGDIGTALTAYNANDLEANRIGNGIFVPMSQLSEEETKTINTFGSALKIIFFSEIRNMS